MITYICVAILLLSIAYVVWRKWISKTIAKKSVKITTIEPSEPHHKSSYLDDKQKGDDKLFRFVDHQQMRQFIKTKNGQIKVIISLVIVVLAFLVFYLNKDLYYYEASTKEVFIASIAIGLLSFYLLNKSKKDSGNVEVTIPEGSIGIIKQAGAVIKYHYAKPGEYPKFERIPFAGGLTIEPYKIDKHHIDVSLKRIPVGMGSAISSGSMGNTILMDIDFSVARTTVNPWVTYEMDNDDPNQSTEHILDVANAVIKDAFDEVDQRKILGYKGTEVVNKAIREQISSYKKSKNFFLDKDAKKIKAFNKKYNLVGGHGYLPNIGEKIEFLINNFGPSDEETRKAIEGVRKAELKAETEKILGEERTKLTKETSQKLESEPFFQKLTPTRKEAFISNMLNFVEKGTSESKYVDFGLSGEDFQKGMAAIASVIFGNK